MYFPVYCLALMPERLFHNTEDSPHAWFHIPCKTARTYSLKFSSPGAVITACCAKLSVFLVKLRYHSAPGGSAITAPNNHDTGGYAYLQKTVWYRLRIPGLHARDTFCSRQLLLSAPFHYILHWYQNRGRVILQELRVQGNPHGRCIFFTQRDS